MQVAPAGDILSGVADLQTKVLSLLRRAEKARNFTAALGAIREAARLLELHGRLTGQISPDGARVAVQINGAGGRSTEQIRADVMNMLTAMAPVVIEGAAIGK